MKEFSFMNMGPEERADMVLDVYLLAGQSNANGSTTFGCAKPWERDFNRYENVRYVAEEGKRMEISGERVTYAVEPAEAFAGAKAFFYRATVNPLAEQK